MNAILCPSRCDNASAVSLDSDFYFLVVDVQVKLARILQTYIRR